MGADDANESGRLRRCAQGCDRDDDGRRHHEGLIGAGPSRPFSLRLSIPAEGPSRIEPSPTGKVVAYDEDDLPIAYGSRRDGEVWLRVPDVATFHLAADGTSLLAVPEEAVESEAVLDAYYGTALPLLVQATSAVEVLHGGAVRVPPRGSVVALCGISGSGKSTVAYGLAARGCDQWADDAVAFRVDDRDSIAALGLPFTVKLQGNAAAHFGTASTSFALVEEFEWSSAPLAAVFLLEPQPPGTLTGKPVALERLVAAEALQALLANAFRFQPQADALRRATLSAYLDLVCCVPVLKTRFEHDLDRLPALLDELERCVREAA